MIVWCMYSGNMVSWLHYVQASVVVYFARKIQTSLDVRISGHIFISTWELQGFDLSVFVLFTAVVKPPCSFAKVCWYINIFIRDFTNFISVWNYGRNLSFTPGSHPTIYRLRIRWNSSLPYDLKQKWSRRKDFCTYHNNCVVLERAKFLCDRIDFMRRYFIQSNLKFDRNLLSGTGNR